MTHQILDVGNCGFDHENLQSMLARHFDARLTQAHGDVDALRLLSEHTFDLVLVNRKFDRDGGDGIELIRAIAGNPDLPSTPVMLLSNYPQYQQQALAAGAVMGFGKAQLDAPETIALLNDELA
jgi:CheY-like chemotaxis protein